ncbi:MAG TPA: transporter substrate-binding domain-containing protein, partial [Candidatus Sericytochromatia bacterium]
MAMKLSALLGNVLSLSGLGVLFSVPPIFAADLQAIEQRGRLIVAVKDNLRPLGFRGANGQLQGLEIEIAQRLAQELLGSKDAVELQPVVNQDRLAAVLEGKADI